MDHGHVVEVRQEPCLTGSVNRASKALKEAVASYKGSEQGGKRPVIVLQNHIGNRHSSTLIIAPITSRIEKNTGQPTHVNIGGIGHNHVLSVVQLEQIRTIDKQKVIRYFGIGQKKIRSLVQMHENNDFILHVRVKVLIKRKKFENFIDRSSEV